MRALNIFPSPSSMSHADAVITLDEGGVAVIAAEPEGVQGGCTPLTSELRAAMPQLAADALVSTLHESLPVALTALVAACQVDGAAFVGVRALDERCEDVLSRCDEVSMLTDGLHGEVWCCFVHPLPCVYRLPLCSCTYVYVARICTMDCRFPTRWIQCTRSL
ncbi:hypothetical protein EON66_06335 [archaeon]|nr:MAG: hypothetical protein EON66_06335 [archaeon]